MALASSRLTNGSYANRKHGNFCTLIEVYRVYYQRANHHQLIARLLANS